MKTRRIVSASPIASNSVLASARSGHELAVFGSVLIASAAGACAAGAGIAAAARAAAGAAGAATARALDATAAGAAAAAAGAARIACTSFSVIVFGGFDVMIVALSLSP